MAYTWRPALTFQYRSRLRAAPRSGRALHGPRQLHESSFCVCIKPLHVMRRILEVASTHPDAVTLLDARPAPDMFPLGAQIRVATHYPLVEWDSARVMWGECETEWPGIFARIAKTLALPKAVDRAGRP
ncbi:hypothetical protein B0T24DRAFT_660964 [Lasiosphaeria ovina]|uniref:Uncharacterized protein n=1 Tax=Lasiosphaeria ovina TaxID=92902 RepID=A0AAE0NIM7_9PEZI|nr:hypothetical protein B0T24DRAFT_660964 [Lasiosphaeria ovina]